MQFSTKIRMWKFKRCLLLMGYANELKLKASSCFSKPKNNKTDIIAEWTPVKEQLIAVGRLIQYYIYLRTTLRQEVFARLYWPSNTYYSSVGMHRLSFWSRGLTIRYEIFANGSFSISGIVSYLLITTTSVAFCPSRRQWLECGQIYCSPLSSEDFSNRSLYQNNMPLKSSLCLILCTDAIITTAQAYICSRMIHRPDIPPHLSSSWKSIASQRTFRREPLTKLLMATGTHNEPISFPKKLCCFRRP